MEPARKLPPSPFQPHQLRVSNPALWLTVLAACLAGCASRPAGPADPTDSGPVSTPESGSRTVSSIDTRSGIIEAFVGRAAVAPVSLAGPLPPNGRLGAKLEDGRTVPATLLWLSIESPPEGRWLPTPNWQTLPATSTSVPDTPGRWIMLLDLPIDAVGQAIWLDGKRRSIRWLASPETLADSESQGAQQRWEPWASPLSEDALRSASLREQLEHMRSDPFSAWRVELATSEIWDQHNQPRPAIGSSARAPGRALDVLSAHQRARWLSVLAALWQLDAALATRFRDSLVPVVRIGQATWLPAWGLPGEADELDRLADAVLDFSLTDEARLARVQRWLGDRPPAVVWVIDDAGGQLLAFEGKPAGPTVGVANLAAAASLAWVESAAGPSVSDAPGFAVTHVELPASPDQPSMLEVHCGSWSGRIASANAPTRVRPPGLAVAPFASPWNAPAWLSGNASLGAAESAGTLTRGQLFLKPGAGGGGDAWTLLVECAADARTPGDELRVWLGPMGASTSVLSASPDWGVRTIAGDAPLSGSVAVNADDGSQPGAWRVEIELPASAIESNGELRIGLARRRDGVVVSSWPRRMMPAQAEPGRILADLSGWGAVLPRK